MTHHHAVRLSAAGSCNVALLLVLLVCITGKSLDAFVVIGPVCATSEIAASARCLRRAALPATSPSASMAPPRSQQIAPSTKLRSAAVTPVPPTYGRRRRKAGRDALHATRCCAHKSSADWDASNESEVSTHRRSNNFGSTPSEIHDDGGATTRQGGLRTGGGEAGGFGWLREFGNGNMDIAGLVLSTVLLMTAVAPMGIAADLGVAGGGPLDQHPPKQRPAAHLTVEDTTRVVRPPREAMAKPTGWAAAATERVGALRPGDFAPRRVPVAPSGGADGGETTAGEAVPRRTGPLAEMAGNAVSSARSVAERARAIATRAAEQDSLSDVSRSAGAENPALHEETPGSKAITMHLLSSGDAETGSPLASEIGAAPAAHATTQADQAEHLNKLEIEHAELYGESLPLANMPESFNRALRKALPALVPPAMAVFLTVSMPAVILLLKGVGTTVVAVAKGYGKGDRGRGQDGYETGASLEVGFGGGGGGGGQKPRGRGAENPGSAFQMFLGGSRGNDGGHAGRGGKAIAAEGKTRIVTAEDSPAGETRSGPPLQVQQVETNRQGFFSKHKRSSGRSTGGGQSSGGSGFSVGDDAMTAMAMVAMTQELNVMKQSLQAEVETMKKELERASDDSRRLADKLVRLEEDNRHLKAMVSRLGGQDARRLKAQLFSLLASPSMAQLRDGSPEMQLTPA